MNADVLVHKQPPESLADVFVFFGHQSLIAIDHSYSAAESPQRLGKFYSDVTAADHHQVFWNLVEFQRLDMREWLRIGKTRHWFQCGPCTGTDDHVRAAHLTSAPVGESGLHGSRCNEPCDAQNELRARFPVIFHIHFVQADDHLALAVADARHFNREAVVFNTKILASTKVVHHFCTMDNVLARKARDIGARAAYVFAIDNCNALSFCRKRPGRDRRTRATTENHQIKFFRLRLLETMDGGRGLATLHAIFPF